MAKSWFRSSLRIGLMLALSALIFAQTEKVAPPTATPDTPIVNGIPATVPADSTGLPDAADYVAKNFGPGYVLAATLPPLLGDLDGDDQQDAVFVVSGGKPMISAEAFNSKVIDPYHSYWALGNPKYTTQIPQVDPGVHYTLLIAHSWRSPDPKPKFVIINLPFVKIALEPTFNKKKKRTVAAISTLEYDGQTGAVIWDNRGGYKFYQLGNVHDEQ